MTTTALIGDMSYSLGWTVEHVEKRVRGGYSFYTTSFTSRHVQVVQNSIMTVQISQYNLAWLVSWKG